MRRECLKQHISKTGNPQWKVGVEAGISETRLSAIIRGKVNPTDKEKLALSLTLGVEQAVLFPNECQVSKLLAATR